MLASLYSLKQNLMINVKCLKWNDSAQDFCLALPGKREHSLTHNFSIKHKNPGRSQTSVLWPYNWNKSSFVFFNLWHVFNCVSIYCQRLMYFLHQSSHYPINVWRGCQENLGKVLAWETGIMYIVTLLSCYERHTSETVWTSNICNRKDRQPCTGNCNRRILLHDPLKLLVLQKRMVITRINTGAAPLHTDKMWTKMHNIHDVQNEISKQKISKSLSKSMFLKIVFPYSALSEGYN